MHCRSAERQIFAELDGALDSTQRAELAAHLATCAACRAIADRLSNTLTTWRDEATRVSVPDAELEWHKVRREIRGAPSPAKSSKLTWIALPFAGAAAAAALGIYIGTSSTPAEPKLNTAPVIAAAMPHPEPSTVVYVDEKSGWTFVVAADDSDQHI